MTAFRSFLYYLLSVPLGMVCGLLGLLLWAAPFHFRYKVVTIWNRFSVWWLSISCGVRYEVKGSENIPTGPYVVLAKHQSDWEALFLQYYFAPLSTILKRELLRIPFFGWGLASLRPIAIDRSNPREAIKQLKRKGAKRLAEGNNILVFPEGTRVAVGETGNYARGGADIACKGGVPVLPVAHNAGVCCPRKSYMKYPGTVTVSIGPAIDTSDKSSRDVTESAKAWIEGEMASILL